VIRARLVASAAAVALSAGLIACSGSPAVTPAGTPSTTVDLSARNSLFDQALLTVAAGSPYAIDFENYDALPHNVAIVGGPPGSSGEIFSGPGSRTYVFPALAAGSYTFHCDVHPDMTGTIEAD